MTKKMVKLETIFVVLACYASYIHCYKITNHNILSMGIEWIPSVNTSLWYSPLDKCILANSSSTNIEVIVEDCQKKTGLYNQVPRCTVGNAWRGPARSPFCASEDIPYSQRSFFYSALRGFDDPSKQPLRQFFKKLATKKGSMLLIGALLLSFDFFSI